MTLVAPAQGAERGVAPLGYETLPLGPPATRRQAGEDENFARKVVERWREGSAYMSAARRAYWINLAFYLGQQWVWWSQQRNSLQRLPDSMYSPLGKARVRLIVNRYGPNITNVLGRLARSEIAFEVPPSDSSDPIIQGARRGEKLLEAKKYDDVWDSIRADEILAALLGGTSAVSVEWDGQRGVALPNYSEGDQQFLSTGDVRLRSLNVNEFILEPNVREQSDATYWMMGLALPASTVTDMYDLEWLPFADANTSSGGLYDTLLEGSGRGRGSKNLAMVYCYYERPTRRNRKGQYGVVVNNVTIYKGDWPFPHDRLNLQVFRQRRIDGRWDGATYASDGVAIQTAYNFARSVLQEHLKLAGNAKLMAPMGSIHEEDLHGAAGEMLQWSPDGTGAMPAYLSPPNLPRWVSGEPAELADELDNIMHVHDISRGQGFSRASTQSLTFLAEQDDSALGGMVFDQKRGWEQIATQVLELYGNKATETRTTTLSVAKGVTEQIKWTGKMLQGQYRVVVPIESVTPRTAAARLANAKDLWDRKIITDPRRYARMVGLPPDEFGQLLDPDADRANHENLMMAIGVACEVFPFDDDAVHIAEHNDRFRKTTSYEYATPESKKLADDHVKWHENNAAQKYARQKALSQADPAAGGVAQADAPPGSGVPMGEQEEQSRLGAMASLGVSPNGGSAPAGLPQQGGSQPGGDGAPGSAI
jgi:hypothetical protein